MRCARIITGVFTFRSKFAMSISSLSHLNYGRCWWQHHFPFFHDIRRVAMWFVSCHFKYTFIRHLLHIVISIAISVVLNLSQLAGTNFLFFFVTIIRGSIFVFGYGCSFELFRMFASVSIVPNWNSFSCISSLFLYFFICWPVDIQLTKHIKWNL